MAWTQVEEIREAVGLGTSTLGHEERELLERLPYLYGRGVARVEHEVWGRPSRDAASRSPESGGSWLLPTVSFFPMEHSDPPRFWVVRLAIGVIRNVVVTVRLPDLRWNEAAKDFELQAGRSARRTQTLLSARRRPGCRGRRRGHCAAPGRHRA